MNMSNTVLTKAIELAEKYEWTQKTYARDASGESVDTWSKDACSFCALGFIGRARFELMDETNALLFVVESLVENCLPEEFHCNIPAYNDHPNTTKQDIIDLFKKANEK
jgi:hypothetical protein